MTKNKMYIFVMERGFVLFGRPRPHDHMGDYIFEYTLDDVAIIRQWGTTNGLGQIAQSGTTNRTILDPEPDGTVINRRAVYRKIPCMEWSDDWSVTDHKNPESA